MSKDNKDNKDKKKNLGKDNIQEKIAEPMVYVGPKSMDPMPLDFGVVFKSLPGVVEKKIKKDKEFSSFFVPLSEAGKILNRKNGGA